VGFFSGDEEEHHHGLYAILGSTGVALFTTLILFCLYKKWKVSSTVTRSFFFLNFFHNSFDNRKVKS